MSWRIIVKVLSLDISNNEHESKQKVRHWDNKTSPFSPTLTVDICLKWGQTISVLIFGSIIIFLGRGWGEGQFGSFLLFFIQGNIELTFLWECKGENIDWILWFGYITAMAL